MKKATKRQRKSGKEHNFRSNSEYNCSLILLSKKIEYEYEPYPIAYEWSEHKKYIPDFILPNGVILEVKGRFMLEDRKKHLFIRAQHPEHDIRFVFDNPYRKLYKGGKMTYADWCDKYGFEYCKLNEGIPEEWFKKNGKRNKRSSG